MAGQGADEGAPLSLGELRVGGRAHEAVTEKGYVFGAVCQFASFCNWANRANRRLAIYGGAGEGQVVLESSPPRLICEAHDHTGRGPKARLAARPPGLSPRRRRRKHEPWLATSCRRASRASAQARKCRRNIGRPGAKSPQPVAHGLPGAAETGRHRPLAGTSRLGQEGCADHLGRVRSAGEEPFGEQHRSLLAGLAPRPPGPVPLGRWPEASRPRPGIAPRPQLSFTVRAGQLPGPQLGLDNSRVVSYDEQSGALRASQRTPSLSAKRKARGSLPFRTSSRCRPHHRQRNHADRFACHRARCRF